MDTTYPLTQVSPGDVVDPSDPLSQLADIRLPEDIGLWPLAPGWWLLAVLAIALTVYALIILSRFLHKKRVVRYARGQLDRCLADREAASKTGIDDNSANLDYVNAVNAVLRRVALVHYPHEHVASLNGDRWLTFLRENGDANLLDERTANALAHGRFAPRCEVDPPTLHAMARQWINSLYDARISTDRAYKGEQVEHA